MATAKLVPFLLLSCQAIQGQSEESSAGPRLVFSETSRQAFASIDGNGCVDGDGFEVIANKIYACRGEFDGDIFGLEAASLCGDGFDVCDSAISAAKLGLTETVCHDSNIFIDPTQFFATKETSAKNGRCHSENDEAFGGETGDETAYNIWGCSHPQSTLPLSDYACSNGLNGHSVFKKMVSNVTPSMGGVLCCKSDHVDVMDHFMDIGIESNSSFVSDEPNTRRKLASSCIDLGWQRIWGTLEEVSVASDGTVWGTSGNDQIWQFDGNIANKWRNIGGRLEQIDVGSKSLVYGVNSGGNIFKWTENKWIQIPGWKGHVSVASDGTLWGVNDHHKIYRLNADGKTWTYVGGRLKQIDVGSRTNIWGVNKDDYIYKYNNKGGWINIPGRLKHVSVGADGFVIGVNSNDHIYLRDHKTNSWKQVCGKLSYVEAGSATQIWGRNSNGHIYRATKPYDDVSSKGCSKGNGFKVVANNIYACRGSFDGGMWGSKAAGLCANGFEVCDSAMAAAKLGLTERICSDSNIFRDRKQFFATKETSAGWGNCYSKANQRYVFGKTQYANDIWGCSHPQPTLSLADAPCPNGPNGQTVFRKNLADYHWKGGIDGWTYSGDTLNEAKTVANHKAASGGVLCCKLPNTSCLMAAANCWSIKDRDTCLSSKDSRGNHKNDPCVWCGGARCTTNNWNKCEPETWLAARNNQVDAHQYEFARYSILALRCK